MRAMVTRVIFLMMCDFDKIKELIFKHELFRRTQSEGLCYRENKLSDGRFFTVLNGEKTVDIEFFNPIFEWINRREHENAELAQS